MNGLITHENIDLRKPGNLSNGKSFRFNLGQVQRNASQNLRSPERRIPQPSIHPSVHSSFYPWIYLSISIYVHLCLSMSIYVNVYLCLSMSIYVYIYISLSLSPSLRARIFIQQCYNTNVSSWYLWGFPSLTPNCPKISLSGHTFRICALPWPIAPRSAGILTPMACFVALHCHKNRALS